MIPDIRDKSTAYLVSDLRREKIPREGDTTWTLCATLECDGGARGTWCVGCIERELERRKGTR